MSSSAKSGGEAGEAGDKTALAEQHEDLPLRYDLDKNPIKYAQCDGSLSENAHDKDYMELTLRSGKHSELVKKLLRQRIEQRAQDFPRWPGSLSGGVRAMWIESRFWYDRERLLPDFDDDWLNYRVKYLQSLELDPREPVHVPEYERFMLNPLRRFYMKGGDFLEEKIIKRWFTQDRYRSATYRVTITRMFMLYLGICAGYYYFRYNNRTWSRYNGPLLHRSAPTIYPDHPEYPFKNYKTEPIHFHDLGFSRRTIYQDLRDYEDRSVTL